MGRCVCARVYYLVYFGLLFYLVYFGLFGVFGEKKSPAVFQTGDQLFSQPIASPKLPKLVQMI